MPRWQQIRLLAAVLCDKDSNILANKRRGNWGQQMTMLQQQPSHRLCAVDKYLNIVFKFWRYFQKSLFIKFKVCAVLVLLLLFLVKDNRSGVQIDSMKGYLTMWCHQSQSLNPQTVVEFEGQEESDWIFEKVLGLVVQEHSCKHNL